MNLHLTSWDGAHAIEGLSALRVQDRPIIRGGRKEERRLHRHRTTSSQGGEPIREDGSQSIADAQRRAEIRIQPHDRKTSGWKRSPGRVSSEIAQNLAAIAMRVEKRRRHLRSGGIVGASEEKMKVLSALPLIASSCLAGCGTTMSDRPTLQGGRARPTKKVSPAARPNSWARKPPRRAASVTSRIHVRPRKEPEEASRIREGRGRVRSRGCSRASGSRAPRSSPGGKPGPHLDQSPSPFLKVGIRRGLRPATRSLPSHTGCPAGRRVCRRSSFPTVRDSTTPACLRMPKAVRAAFGLRQHQALLQWPHAGSHGRATHDFRTRVASPSARRSGDGLDRGATLRLSLRSFYIQHIRIPCPRWRDSRGSGESESLNRRET